MQLDGFVSCLKKMDVMYDSVQSKMFNCDAQQVNENTFSYTFDGLVTSVIRFYEDGSVHEWMEMLPEDMSGEEPTFKHASVDSWMNDTVNELIRLGKE